MIKHLLLGVFTLAIVALPARAQNSQPTDEYSSQGAPGEFGNTSETTNNFSRSDSFGTTNQRLPNLQQTTTAILSPISGPVGPNGLPMTSTDSFVLNSAGEGEQIYGGEGTDGIPPFFEFTPEHRIERGITGARAEGLTTFHGSLLPSATGNDEFIGGTEWLQAGRSGGANGGMFSHSDLPGNSLAPRLNASNHFTLPSASAPRQDNSNPTTSTERANQQNTAPDPGF